MKHHDISKVARAARKRWPRTRDARNARGTPARGNSRENLAVFRPSPSADSDIIFPDHDHELPMWKRSRPLVLRRRKIDILIFRPQSINALSYYELSQLPFQLVTDNNVKTHYTQQNIENYIINGGTC